MLKFAKGFQRLTQSTIYFQFRFFSETTTQLQQAEEISSEMTPKKIVAYLDKYIIGQNDAKKAMAIALSIV
jgi:ATP-dependent protease HslVU (ClpYQ), ATPase subunit